MTNDQTYAELLEEHTDNFPLDYDHHPTNSYAVGWNLGRIQGLIIGRYMDKPITVDDVYPTLHQTQLISYDSAQTFGITEAIDEFMREIQSKYSGADETIEEEELAELVERVNDWGREYASELGNMDFVSTVDRGVVDTQKIFRNPDSIFTESVWRWVDEQPQRDLRNSCRTLALDMPTASSFLALRSVEYCLRDWYYEETGEMIEQTAWGGVLTSLEEEYEDRKRPAILSNLNYLQDKRNEVAHPDKTPSWDEAEDTLLTVRRTITEIHESVENR